MADHLDQTINALVEEINEGEKELAETKRIVNRLCKKSGKPSMYTEVDRSTELNLNSIRRDQWYGQPISTAIREYLAMRRNANQGPSTVNEIYDALCQGGFKFDAKDDENAKRGLRISLTKNTTIFHRLPDGKTYGLAEWYPEAKVRKERESPNPKEAFDSDEVSDDQGEPEPPPQPDLKRKFFLEHKPKDGEQ